MEKMFNVSQVVSVAGCLGYDVLAFEKKLHDEVPRFQLLVV
jgi:hypothetical protein